MAPGEAAGHLPGVSAPGGGISPTSSPAQPPWGPLHPALGPQLLIGEVGFSMFCVRVEGPSMGALAGAGAGTGDPPYPGYIPHTLLHAELGLSFRLWALPRNCLAGLRWRQLGKRCWGAPRVGASFRAQGTWRCDQLRHRVLPPNLREQRPCQVPGSRQRFS